MSKTATAKRKTAKRDYNTAPGYRLTMPDTFAITIIFIVVSTAVAAFIRGRSKDKCLRNFSGDMITLVLSGGRTASGALSVESSGIELIYKNRGENETNKEFSYIIYKSEYGSVLSVIRYHDKLNEKNRELRDKELKRIYHPGIFRKSARKIRNLFSTIKDSVMEVLNMIMGKAGKFGAVGGIMSSQGKYVSQIRQNVVGNLSTSFEPLFEKHIGQKVTAETNEDGKSVNYTGILKDYTPLFIELMDVSIKKNENGAERRADILIPRSFGRIRHLAE